MLVSTIIAFSLHLVSGNGSLCGGHFKCCNGYKWDKDAERCTPCGFGYFGKDCADQCPFPSYGKECQLMCNCSKDQCNHVKGCSKSVCPPGYLDDFCEFECRYPNFGIGCQNECLCVEEKCDPANGCQGMETVTTALQSRTTIDISVSLKHDADTNRSFLPPDILSALSTTTDMQKETSIRCDAASKRTTLNRKERDMVISIAALGLLFLILTALHIWVTHRLRVNTNNRGEEAEHLHENSTV